jgi:hypothetical protein
MNRKPAAEVLQIKVNGSTVQVTAPKQVFVDKAGAAE